MIIFWTLDLTYVYWCCSRTFAYNKSYFHTLSFEIFANIIRWVICVVGLYVLLDCLFWWVVCAIGYLCWCFLYYVVLCVLLGCVLDCVCWWVVCAVGFCMLQGCCLVCVVGLCALTGCVCCLFVCFVELCVMLGFICC